MNSSVFCDITLGSPLKSNRRLEGTCRFQLQGGITLPDSFRSVYTGKFGLYGHASGFYAGDVALNLGRDPNYTE
jgi:hypothetical protein